MSGANKARSELSNKRQSENPLRANRGDNGHVQISIPTCEPRPFQPETEGCLFETSRGFSPINCSFSRRFCPECMKCDSVFLIWATVVVHVLSDAAESSVNTRKSAVGRNITTTQVERGCTWRRQVAFHGKSCLLVYRRAVSGEWKRRCDSSRAEFWSRISLLSFIFSAVDFASLIFSPPNEESGSVRAPGTTINAQTCPSAHLGIHQIRDATEGKLKSITGMRGEKPRGLALHSYYHLCIPLEGVLGLYFSCHEDITRHHFSKAN